MKRNELVKTLSQYSSRELSKLIKEAEDLRVINKIADRIFKQK